MSEAGKGDAPRPMSVDKKTFDKNFIRTFGNKNEEDVLDLFEEDYIAELNSGMFWEWYPGLTGVWSDDKFYWWEARNRKNDHTR